MTRILIADQPEVLASMHGDAEYLPLDALGPAIQILFDALIQTASGRAIDR